MVFRSYSNLRKKFCVTVLCILQARRQIPSFQWSGRNCHLGHLTEEDTIGSLLFWEILKQIIMAQFYLLPKSQSILL